MNDKKLIYAVDDETSIREVYDYALSSAGLEVKTFCDASELFSECKKRIPSLFILDIMLEGMDGYEILKRLKTSAETKDVPVIMVSCKTSEIEKVKGLDLGADDYISKPFGVMELIARINAKLRLVKQLDKSLVYKNIAIDNEKHIVTVDDKICNLTLKQYKLLELFIKNPEKVLSRDFLLDNVWGENYGETRTLDIHVKDLRKILKDSPARIETVRGVGYVLK